MTDQLPVTGHHSGAATEHNFAVRLLAGAEGHPNRAAIRQGDQVVSYRQLADRVRRTARLLRSGGVQPGDRVALLFGNHHQFIEGLLAIVWIGAVAVPLNTRSGRTALRHVIADSDPVLVLAQDSLADRAGELAPAGGAVLVAGPDGWTAAGGWTGAASTGDPAGDAADPAHQADAAAEHPHPVDAQHVCLQPYTSGSTGSPKGCLLTHGGQLWNASTVATVWQLGADDCGLVTAPLYHKNAMICVVKPLLLVGGTIVIGSGPEPAGIPAEVARHRCTYTTGVPATYEMLLASGEHRRHDLSSLRFVICGSAPLSDTLGRRFAEGLGAPVIEAYGLTEGGPQVLMNPRTDYPRYGVAGRPLPGCQVRLLPPGLPIPAAVAEQAEVPAGDAGELWVRNPGVTLGYYHLPEVTRERISADGWLRTGDLAQDAGDGYLRVLGRADDMINVAGENVYPLEVEKLLAAMPGIGQVAVVPVAHARKGAVPVAFVVAEGLTEDEIKKFALERGAAHAHPRRVWFLPELPLGGTGKIDYAQLTALAADKYAAERAHEEGSR